MDMKRFFLYFITIAALALAGCGGNGGGGTGPKTEMMCSANQTGTYPDCVDAPTGPTAAEIEAAKDSAATKLTAMMTESNQETDDGLGGTDADDDHTVAIVDGKVGITVVGAMDDDAKFEQMMDFEDGRTMHVRDVTPMGSDGKVEEVVIVGTDIAAPTDTAFAMVHQFNTNPTDADPPVNQALTIDGANLAMLMTDGITSTGEGEITLPGAVEDNPSTTDMDESVAAFSTMATFNGAMGMLTCGGGDSNCTARLDGDGMITELGAGWYFTPAPGVQIAVADTNYLTYGFWLKRTTDEDGAVTYNEVETFANAVGHTITPQGDVSDITGTATYNGGAVGVFVKNVTDNAGTITSGNSGHFTADVTLNATFGGGNIPANDQFTIGGKVENFVLNAGPTFGEIPNTWEVALGLADFSGRAAENKPGESGPGNNHTNTFNGTTTGEGSWNGTFYGGGNADNDQATPVTQPDAVAGEFDAFFSDGGVAGGFGVNKPE